MIKNFRDNDTEALAANRYVKKFDSIKDSARKKLDLLASTKGISDLAAIPGNKLEALSGKRKGQYSIRINDQYRMCFKLDGDDFKDVEITDYH
jgi:proteic killer suppression protein